MFRLHVTKSGDLVQGKLGQSLRMQTLGLRGAFQKIDH